MRRSSRDNETVDAAPSQGRFIAGEKTNGVTEFIILGASFVAVAAMVAVAAWARIARPMAPLDAASARALLDAEFPDHAVSEIWTAADGFGAIGRAGATALVVYRLGDSWVARSLPYDRALAAPVRKGRVHLPIGDVSAPTARLAVSGVTPWPPQAAANAEAA